MECPNCGITLKRHNRKIVNTVVSHEVARTREYRCLECGSVNWSVEVFVSPEHVERPKARYPKYHIKKDALIPLLNTVHEFRRVGLGDTGSPKVDRADGACQPPE